MKNIIILGLFLLLPVIAFAQWDDCPYGKTDSSCEYPGECGRYTDSDNNKICDHSQPEPTATTTNLEKNLITSDKVVELENNSVEDVNKVRQIKVDEIQTVQSKVIISDNKSENIKVDTEKEVEESTAKYPLIPLVSIVVIIYSFTYFLAKQKIITIITHRKIWNIILTINFLISAILGILLVVQVNFGSHFKLPFDVIYWHVVTGIIMAVVCIFHIAWHWRYYKNLFKR